MKSLLTALCLFVTVTAFGANFPYVRLNGKTNRLSDNGSILTFNGAEVPIVTNGIASRALVTDANTNLTSSSITPTELLSLSGASGNFQTNTDNRLPLPTQITLTHAGTVTLTNTAWLTDADLVLTGSVTFATSDLVAGHKYTVYGRNTQTTNVTPTFPAWQFQGGAPTSITAQKSWTLSLSSRGTVATNVWAAYSEAQ